jgi:xanthine/uracil permease
MLDSENLLSLKSIPLGIQHVLVKFAGNITVLIRVVGVILRDTYLILPKKVFLAFLDNSIPSSKL